MAKQPAWQLYTGDWIKDPNLSMCCPATRGIWIDILCAMHENNRSGVIVGTTDQLARLCRCSAVELDTAITELSSTLTADVTERNGRVTVVCRRMKREAQVREGARVRQKRKRRNNDDDDDCHGDVTQKSRLRTSSSSSVSTSPPPECARGEPVEIPADLEEMAMRVYGGVPLGNLTEWCRAYSVDWARRAIAVTERRGKNNVNYTLKILQNWKQKGAPDDDDGEKAGKGRPRGRGSPSQGENLERGAKAFEDL